MSNYRKELESEIIRNTGELKQTLEDLKQDIAERIRAEKTIANEREYLAITLRSIGDGVITTDTNGTIVMFNKTAEFLTGWSSENALGRSVPEVVTIIDEFTRKPCKNPVEIALKTNTEFEFKHNVYMISKNSTERLVSINAVTLNDRENNIVGSVLFFRDITQKQKLNDTMHRAQKLESIGILAGGIAHDFNNMLSGIFGYMDMAKENLKENKPDKCMDSIVKASSVFERAKSLTHQLLTFSKGGSPSRTTIQIKPLIEKNALFVLSGSNISCKFDIPNSLWLCDVDENQFGQVIDNLVINAMQAMPMGGTVILTAKNLIIEPTGNINIPRQGDFVLITIQDTGIGIPKEMITNIFDPFFSTKQTGHGLGLATVHSIVMRHNGWIDVESVPGKGTTFSLYFPASRHKEIKHIDSEQVKHLGRGIIVVMDDEECMRELLRNMLSLMGYTVLLACNGEETLALVKNEIALKHPIAVVILDLTIPGGMGGGETMQALLKIKPDIKAIASSGYSNNPIMALPLSYGFKAKLSKPYTTEELADVLAEVLS
jgi:PAS domain S-box-containing protein